MRFEDLLAIVGDEPVFETGLLVAGASSVADVRRQLSRWTASGKILQLRRGLYCLASPFRRVPPHPFLISNRLVPASYVSLESALAHHGLIPEGVPVTTGVTPGRASRRRTPYGEYDFRNVKAGLFFGYSLEELGGGQRAFVASPEKALLDLVHLTEGGGTDEHLRSLRLQNLERLDARRLDEFARGARLPKWRRAARAAVRLAAEEREGTVP